MGVELGGFQDLGIPEEMESSGCTESPAGAGSLSARKNWPEQKRPPARARLPALGHSVAWDTLTIRIVCGV